MSGIATLGILLAIYFLLDGFGSFGMAFTLRPMKGWWRVFHWMNLDGMVVQLDHIVMVGAWLSIMESMPRSIEKKSPQHTVSG
jgi:hypothetical protein